MFFRDFDLIEPIQRAVAEAGYETPTPIQVQAIPPALAGSDILGCAQTGTGKTAAFALPLLQRLHQDPKRAPGISVLVLAPTRELAAQIGASFTEYGKYTRLTNTVIFGGVGQEPQVRAIRRGVEILVATPGRLLDLMQQRLINLSTVRYLVLDEADRMLDMGFIRDVQKILAVLPTERQTLFFSATLSPEVQQLSRSMLKNPVSISVTPPATTVERIDQSVYFVERGDKRLLLEKLLEDPALSRVIVFSRTKHGANKVVQGLERSRVPSAAIHGNKSQSARTRALDDFKNGHVRVLVATDIAARGIDVDGITHVINYDLPNISDSYVHRIGRTARASADGIAIAFCEMEERPFLRDIEKLIRKAIPVVTDHPFRSMHQPPQTFVPGAPSARGPSAPAVHHVQQRQHPQHQQRPANGPGPRQESRGRYNDGPRHDGPRHDGPRQDAPRQHDAPRGNDGPRPNRPQQQPQQQQQQQPPRPPEQPRGPDSQPRQRPQETRLPAETQRGEAAPRRDPIVRDWY